MARERNADRDRVSERERIKLLVVQWKMEKATLWMSRNMRSTKRFVRRFFPFKLLLVRKYIRWAWNARSRIGLRKKERVRKRNKIQSHRESRKNVWEYFTGDIFTSSESLVNNRTHFLVRWHLSSSLSLPFSLTHSTAINSHFQWREKKQCANLCESSDTFYFAHRTKNAFKCVHTPKGHWLFTHREFIFSAIYTTQQQQQQKQ